MPGFLGSYRHQLDSQGRVSLPAPFRKGREGEPFVLLQTEPEALSLYPEQAWQDVQDDLREMSSREPRFRHHVLRVTASAVQVSPDAQGRILIPERMRKAVALGTEAMVVGAINHAQIWDPETFENVTSASDEEFERQIERVFA
ncbi:division/cell wall cluster transcriptional repressor MraZ [Candidatus Palauibacter sp.]|uniref:division/cell wall cluster transcriptional repressor MraZ n=1 Tax=Candidatus Palauibacter sp. TaxID=3101350 RepID=UPI003C6ECAEC